MSPLDGLMNRVAEMSDSNSFFKQQILSRVSVLAGCIPLEMVATAQNIIKLPFEAAMLTIKIPAKVINLFIGSETLKDFETSLPGPLQLIKTAFKIIGYAIGTLFTSTLGMLSPYKNFRLHTVLDLISDEKAEAAAFQKEQAAARQREVQREIMQLHIKNLILAQRLKTAEQQLAILPASQPANHAPAALDALDALDAATPNSTAPKPAPQMPSEPRSTPEASRFIQEPQPLAVNIPTPNNALVEESMPASTAQEAVAALTLD